MEKEEDRKAACNEQEIDRKRRNSHDFQISKRIHLDLDLSLSLAFHQSSGTTTTKQQSLGAPPPHPSVEAIPGPQSMSLSTQQILQLTHSPSLVTSSFVAESSSSVPIAYRQEAAGPSRHVRVRRNSNQLIREGKSETVPPPFSWATSYRATVHSLKYLMSKQITRIIGEVQCKKCEKQCELEYDLRERFDWLRNFIEQHKSDMHHRAPSVWMNPVLPACKFCSQENSMKPVISEKKKRINWLFLLLGQMLGCCTLEQLKYFCKHTKNHRTGAKDRVLYLTYLALCKQLEPTGPFDR